MTKLKIARTLEWFDIVEYNETNYPGLSLDEAIELEQNAPKQYLIGIARTRYNGVRHRSKVTVIDKVMPDSNVVYKETFWKLIGEDTITHNRIKNRGLTPEHLLTKQGLFDLLDIPHIGPTRVAFVAYALHFSVHGDPKWLNEMSLNFEFRKRYHKLISTHLRKVRDNDQDHSNED